MDDRLANRYAEAGRLRRRGRPQDAGQDSRARDPSCPPHLLGKRHEPVRPPVGQRLGHEAAAARFAADQSVGGEALHRVAGGHSADTELEAELGVGRQSFSRGEDGDPLAERLFDLAVLGSVAGVGADGATARGRAPP